MAKVEKLPYKGSASASKIGAYQGGATVEKLPYRTQKTSGSSKSSGNKTAKIRPTTNGSGNSTSTKERAKPLIKKPAAQKTANKSKISVRRRTM